MTDKQIPSFEDLYRNPHLIKDILLSKGMEINEQPEDEFLNIEFLKDKFSWCESIHAKQPAIMCKFMLNDLFYKIVFPHYSDSQISQLMSLLQFVRLVVKDENIERKHHNNFIYAYGSLAAHSYNISLIIQNNKLYLTNYSGINIVDRMFLKDYSFERLYTSILSHFYTHLLANYTQGLGVNNQNILNIINETNEYYIQRIFADSMMLPVSKNDLRSFANQLPFKIEQFNPDRKLNSTRQIYFDFDDLSSIQIGIHAIEKAKLFFKKIIKNSDIPRFMNLLSIAHFQSKLINPEVTTDFIQFSYTDIFDYDKNKIVEYISRDGFYNFSIGYFSFGFSTHCTIMHLLSHKGTEYIVAMQRTMEQLYSELYDHVTDSFCHVLDNDGGLISVDDLKVLEMIVV